MVVVFGVHIRGTFLVNALPSHQHPPMFDEHFLLNTIKKEFQNNRTALVDAHLNHIEHIHKSNRLLWRQICTSICITSTNLTVYLNHCICETDVKTFFKQNCVVYLFYTWNDHRIRKVRSHWTTWIHFILFVKLNKLVNLLKLTMNNAVEKSKCSTIRLTLCALRLSKIYKQFKFNLTINMQRTAYASISSKIRLYLTNVQILFVQIISDTFWNRCNYLPYKWCF